MAFEGLNLKVILYHLYLLEISIQPFRFAFKTMCTDTVT